jgi:hypothetical protein
MCSEWSLPFRLSNENSVRIFLLPMHATCYTHPILLDSITITFG